MANYKIKVTITHEFHQHQEVNLSVEADCKEDAINKAEELAWTHRKPDAYEAELDSSHTDHSIILDHDNESEGAARCKQTPDMFQS